MDRRSFLQVVLAGGGAFALGFDVTGCAREPARSPANRVAPPSDFIPSAWLRITPDDRIVFSLDRVEMGQGTTTSHAILIAEELDVDPSRLEIVRALADRRFDHPDFGFQITGGSSSVRSSFAPLRHAGATAREMIRRAGALHFEAPLGECVAERGVVLHPRSGRRATYGELASIAATLPVPTDAPLKPASAFRFLGKEGARRLDAGAKVDGSALYGIDVAFDGLLSAVVLRPETFGGTLKSFDGRAARAMPGVVDVVAIPTGVAVVATAYFRALAAAPKVSIEWNDGPPLDSEALRADYQRRLDAPGKAVVSSGSFDREWESTTMRVEARYAVPYLAHATLEPQNATCWFHDDLCEIWAPTQAPGMAREVAHGITGLPHDRIVVHTTFLGGGFGRRLAQDYVAEVVHLARAVGRPVKIIWSREDDFRHDRYRPMSAHLLRAALGGGDGASPVRGFLHRIVSQSILSDAAPDFAASAVPSALPVALKSALGRTAASLYRSALPDESSHEGSAANFAYDVGARRVEIATTALPIPVGFWRSVGHSENAFVVESFTDEIAHALRLDPYDFRRRLLRGAPRDLGVLDLAAAQAGWRRPLPKGVSRGIAAASSFRSFSAHVVEASVEGREIRVRRVVSAIDCGVAVNPDGIRAQVEGAILFGLSAALREEVRIVEGRVTTTNFGDYPLLRMHEAPAIEVHIVTSREEPGGVGEVGLPALAPAVANAVFAATGVRLRRLPLLPALSAALDSGEG